MSRGRDTDILKGTLICPQCAKSIDVRPSDILCFTATSWPTCCGQTMKYDMSPRPPITPAAVPAPLTES
jgi:hypothetical protein